MRKITTAILISLMLVCLTSCGGRMYIFPISYGEAKDLINYILDGIDDGTECAEVEITKNDDGSLADVSITFTSVFDATNVIIRANEYASQHPEDEIFNGKTKLTFYLSSDDRNEGHYTYHTTVTNFDSRIVNREENIEIQPRMIAIVHNCNCPDTPVPGIEIISLYVHVELEWFQGATGIRRVYLDSLSSDYYTEEVLLEFEEAYPDIEFILQ